MHNGTTIETQQTIKYMQTIKLKHNKTLIKEYWIRLNKVDTDMFKNRSCHFAGNELINIYRLKTFIFQLRGIVAKLLDYLNFR